MPKTFQRNDINGTILRYRNFNKTNKSIAVFSYSEYRTHSDVVFFFLGQNDRDSNESEILMPSYCFQFYRRSYQSEWWLSKVIAMDNLEYVVWMTISSCLFSILFQKNYRQHLSVLVFVWTISTFMMWCSGVM